MKVRNGSTSIENQVGKGSYTRMEVCNGSLLTCRRTRCADESTRYLRLCEWGNLEQLDRY